MMIARRKLTIDCLYISASRRQPLLFDFLSFWKHEQNVKYISY